MYSGIVLVFLVVYEVLFLSSAEICPKDFQCGDFGNLSFPFTDYAQPHCGLFITSCSNQTSPIVSLSKKSERWYKLLAPPPNSHENSIRVLDTQLQDSLNRQACSMSFEDVVDAANSDAVSFTVVPNITVIRCNNETTDKMTGIEPFMGLMKYNTCHDFTIYYKNPKEDINHPNPMYYIGTLPPNCYNINLPMAPLDSIDENSGLFNFLTAKFDLSWNLSDNCVDCLNGNRGQCDIGDNYICATAGKPHVHKGALFGLEIAYKISTWMGILGLIAILLVSALPIFLCYKWIRRRILKAREKRRRDDYLHRLRGSNSFNYGDELEKGIRDAPDVKIFSLKAILTATDNFSNENKLGQGGYGPVYKGKLSDGREIAVKKLSKTSGQGFEEFRSELILISKLQHTNLVRLYGCCIHHEEKMLIYEFMPNKSLDFFLFAEDKKEKLDWQIRYNIIEGVAQGLLYLHKYSRMKVIHRDLKVSNVLLDENMNPKIADFGMARIVKQDTTEAVTNRVVGTYGYMAPEYAMEGTFSVKSDVFSFGVLILEIVSGKRNSSFYNPDRPLNLVGYAWELWKGHASIELKDKALGESFDVKQLLRAIHIGLICVQENADDRPSMSDVIYILNNETIDLSSPKQPAFFTGRQADGFRLLEARSTDYLLERPNHVSENGLTLTTMEAR